MRHKREPGNRNPIFSRWANTVWYESPRRVAASCREMAISLLVMVKAVMLIGLS
jgi:hypothetical protein